MNLSKIGISDRKIWEEKGYKLPEFDIDNMKHATLESPEWVHFGAGNLFRAFQANVAQDLLNKGDLKSGIIVAEGWDYEIIEKMFKPHDNLSVLATLKSDGTVDKTVVGSIAESFCLDSDNDKDFPALKNIFSKASLKMASFTITEKGYAFTNAKGEVLKDIAADFENGPEKPVSYMGKVASLLYYRYLNGKLPISMVSMDNCSHNGDKLKAVILEFAKNWTAKGKAEKGFNDYVNDSSKVGFPWSMIDKITPRPDESVEKMLIEDGLSEAKPIVTGKNTYIAPFVNSEECQYLVIEDSFPNGKLPLDKGGIIYTDRETVDKVEKMKVCTCLNPLHTCLAVFGCLLGYEKISAEMQDKELLSMIKTIGYTEGLPVVVNPGIINPKDFIDAVINIRFPNPFMPDTPQRIATDTSQKLAIRYGETVKAYLREDGMNVEDLKLIPLVFAGWLRYLMAVDDKGNSFTLSPDPLIDSLKPYIEEIELGYKGNVEEKLSPILKNEKIFGVDLYKAGLDKKVIGYFEEMIVGKDAVRNTLKKYVG